MPLCLCGVLTAQTVSLSPQPVVLDASRTSPFASLWGRTPIEIGEVKTGRARAGRPIEVQAEAWLDRNDTDLAKIESVAVFYSADEGRTWQSAPLKGRGRLWSGRIPPQSKGARLVFYIEARDNFGQVTREIPPLFSDSSRAALVAEDSKEDPQLVPPDIDLLQTYAAYDAGRLYVGQTVAGNLEKGAMEKPFAPYLYAIFVVNPDDDQVYDFADAPALAYLPFGQLAQLPASGLVRLNRLFGPRRKEAEVPGAETRFELKRDEDGVARAMWFAVERSALGPNPSRRLRLVGVTMAFPDLRRPAPIPWEASPFATFYLRGHEVTVE